jgi:hypothetical protein
MSVGRARGGGEETTPRALPPPPRPHHRRDLPRPSAYFRRRSSRQDESGDAVEDEEEAPQPAPVPHAHPLATLTGARSGANGGRALSGKRLNPEFLNPARVAAFSNQENVAGIDGNVAIVQRRQQQSSLEPTSALASETKHSTRVIERQWRLQLEHPGGARAPPLTDEELMLAATDAAALRQELVYRDDARALAITARGEAHAAYPELARAMERKVGKQLDPKWVRARNDPANRPRRALDRPEERELYESLRRVTLRDVRWTDRQQQEGKDSEEDVSETRRRLFQRLPLKRRAFVGLPGSCFDLLHG